MFKSRLFIRIFSHVFIQILVFSALLYVVIAPVITKIVYQREVYSARALLDSAYSLINNIYVNLERERQDTLNEKKRNIKTVVLITESIINAWQEDVRNGLVTEPEAKKRVIRRLRSIQYGKRDYLWICDYDSKIICHPDPKLEGKDFSAVQDAKGNLFVPEIVKMTRKDGEGYHTYWWRRIGDFKPIEKLTYSKSVPGWNWVLNAGIYIEDVNNEIDVKKKKAIQSLRTVFHTTKLGETGYLAVFDSNGLMLIHPNNSWEGKNMGGLPDPMTGKPLLMEFAESSRKQDPVLHYKWDKPNDPRHHVYEKLGWAKYFKGFNWYIIATVYVDELKSSSRQVRMYISLIALLFFIVAFFEGYRFTKSLVNPVMRLSQVTREVRDGNMDVRSDISSNDEIGELSANFDSMVTQLKLRTDQLKSINNELQEANKKLKELDEMKSSFLSTVSHELRTPLTSVLGFAKITRNKLDNTVFPEDAKIMKTIRQAKENLGIIVSEGVRLTDLINDVLDLAKMEAERIEWKREQLDIREVVEKAAATGAYLLEEKGLTLIREMDAELPEVMGDRDRLIQVLLNLLSNAAKFTSLGSITVRGERVSRSNAGMPGGSYMAAAQGRENEEFIKVSVIDTGIGIAPEDYEKVFEQFIQVGDTLTDKPRGTGLGLPICRHIIEHHGGVIWATGEVGKGSTFSFVLPLSDRSAEVRTDIPEESGE